MNIKEVVRNNRVRFSYYREGVMYYSVAVDGETYVFPVPLEDVGNATLLDTDKAILFMRYIRKAREDGTFVLKH